MFSTKEGGYKDTAVGTRTGLEAAMRAMSVLGNAKSNCHQKTRRVDHTALFGPHDTPMPEIKRVEFAVVSVGRKIDLVITARRRP